MSTRPVLSITRGSSASAATARPLNSGDSLTFVEKGSSGWLITHSVRTMPGQRLTLRHAVRLRDRAPCPPRAGPPPALPTPYATLS